MKFSGFYFGIVLMSMSLCLLTTKANAQSKLGPPSLSGNISSDVGMPIENANIWIHDWKGKSFFNVESDKKGYYMVNLPHGVYFVLIAAPGFTPVCKRIWVQEDKPIQFSVHMIPDTEYLNGG